MSVSEYQYDGKTFYRVYVQNRGKTIKRIRLQKLLTGIEDLAVARREEKRWIKVLAEKVAKLEGKGLLWSEVLFRWEISGPYRLIGSRLNRYSVSDHANRLRRYAQPWLERIASELNRSDGRKILEWAREQGASSGILRHLKTSINTVYIWGVEEGLIPSNGLVSKSPVYGIGLDCKEERIPPMLTLEEVRKLLLEAKIRNHPWYPIWAMALSTGMRSGELMALEWSDVDFKNGIIRVTKSFNIRFKAVKCPKNGTWRNVDINSQLHELLVDLRRERMNEVLVLPRFPIWKSGLAGKVLRMFLVSIGINKHCVFHTLRACFATHLLSTGVEPLKVMRMGGWSDLKTFQIYLRLSGVDVKGVAEMLDVLPAKDMTANVVPLFR